MTKSTKKTCRECKAAFSITSDDLSFYVRLSVPEPTLCPDCRMQRRLAFRNERPIYRRTCDSSGETIISAYSPDKPFKVYRSDIWWSDDWDPMQYGKNFDFSRPFFEQFLELRLAVPKLQYPEYGNENCPYVNRCSWCRNCYMCFNMDHADSSFYSEVGYKLLDSIDCGFSKEMELCAHCVESTRCHGSTNLIRCSGLSSSDYCFDCHSGGDLLLCWNLRNKHYCILNQQYSREEYLEKREKYHLTSSVARGRCEAQLADIMQKQAVHKYANLIQCENCDGDNVFQAKNCHHCFDVLRAEDLKWVYSVDNMAKDSRDCGAIWDGAELIYESMSANRYHIRFSYDVWDSSDILYSELCHASQNLFGCSGLKKKSYCILNKQHTEADYKALVRKIIAHMGETGEWGEFFPVSASPIAYNESLASEYFPLSREEVVARGWKWLDPDPRDYRSQEYSVPDDIGLVDDSITSHMLACSLCGKNYKIIQSELKLYRRLQIPVPQLCSDCRHDGRMKLRKPLHLWTRPCGNCGVEMRTNYAPDRPEKVFCEECYLQSVF